MRTPGIHTRPFLSGLTGATCVCLLFVSNAAANYFPTLGFNSQPDGPSSTLEGMECHNDLDLDGDNDCVVGSSSGVYILSNDGSGDYSQTQLIDPSGSLTPLMGTPNQAAQITVASPSLSGSQYPDILISRYGTGSGQSTDSHVVIASATSANTYDSFQALDVDNSLPNPTNISGVGTGDFDGDGDRDLLASNRTDDFVALFDGPFPFSTTPSQVINAPSVPMLVRVANIDADPADEAVIPVQATGGLAIYDPSSGCSSPLGGTTLPTGSSPSDVRLADIDRDGDIDALVTLTGRDSVLVMVNDGVPCQFTVGTEVAVGDRPITVDSGDLDLDGDTDFVVTNAASGTISVLSNDGSGTLSNTETVTSAQGASGVQLADANRDSAGTLDLFGTGTATGSGQFLVWFSTFVTSDSPGSSPESEATVETAATSGDTAQTDTTTAASTTASDSSTTGTSRSCGGRRVQAIRPRSVYGRTRLYRILGATGSLKVRTQDGATKRYRLVVKRRKGKLRTYANLRTLPKRAKVYVKLNVKALNRKTGQRFIYADYRAYNPCLKKRNSSLKSIRPSKLKVLKRY